MATGTAKISYLDMASRSTERVRGRRSGAARLENHEAVLKAAASLFYKKGYIETTMEDIADRLRMSKPTLYTYAKSKSIILQGIVKFWMCNLDELFRDMEAHPVIEERLGLLIHRWAALAVKHESYMHVFLAEEQHMPVSATREYKIWSRATLERLRNLIKDVQKRGKFTKIADPTIVAFGIIGFISLVPRWFNNRGRLSIAEVAKTYLSTLRLGGEREGRAATPDGESKSADAK